MRDLIRCMPFKSRANIVAGIASRIVVRIAIVVAIAEVRRGIQILPKYIYYFLFLLSDCRQPLSKSTSFSIASRISTYLFKSDLKIDVMYCNS